MIKNVGIPLQSQHNASEHTGIDFNSETKPL